ATWSRESTAPTAGRQGARLAIQHHYDHRPWNDRGSGTWAVGRRGRWLTELRRDSVDAMRALIQRDGPSPALRRHRRDDPEAVRRILVHEGHRPFTIGAHGKAAAWVERGTIDATPDRQRNQHLAAIRIHDRRQPVAAHRKQAARPAVD